MTKYTELITGYHAAKPKFKAHVDLSTRPMLDTAVIEQALIDAFDIDTAQGVQLDVIGYWVGRSRVVAKLISNAYFSWDADGTGYEQGIWQGPYDPDAGFTALTDETYRIVLKTKIAINHWDGTNQTLPGIIETALADSGITMQLVDNQDMTISAWLFADEGVNHVSNELIAVIQQGYLTIKAAGVYCSGIITPSVDKQFFGFDMENKYFAGFDSGAWGVYL